MGHLFGAARQARRAPGTDCSTVPTKKPVAGLSQRALRTDVYIKHPEPDVAAAIMVCNMDRKNKRKRSREKHERKKYITVVRTVNYVFRSQTPKLRGVKDCDP